MSPDPNTTQDAAPPPDAPEAEAEAPVEQSPEEARAAAAAAQGLPEGSVPEQRPQASQQVDPSDAVSDLTQRLRDAGADPQVQEPMDQEAYDRADSDEQKDKAARASKSEAIMMGNTVDITDGPYQGEVGAVTRIVSYQDIEGRLANLAGDPDQLYSHPNEVELTLIGGDRDGERLILKVVEDGLEKQNESVRGSRAGRRH